MANRNDLLPSIGAECRRDHLHPSLEPAGAALASGWAGAAPAPGARDDWGAHRRTLPYYESHAPGATQRTWWSDSRALSHRSSRALPPLVARSHL